MLPEHKKLTSLWGVILRHFNHFETSKCILASSCEFPSCVTSDDWSFVKSGRINVPRVCKWTSRLCAVFHCTVSSRRSEKFWGPSRLVRSVEAADCETRRKDLIWKGFNRLWVCQLLLTTTVYTNARSSSGLCSWCVRSSLSTHANSL